MLNLLIGLSFFFLTSSNLETDRDEEGPVVIILKETEKLKNQRNEFQTVINEHMRNLGKLNDQGVIQNVAGIEGGGELIFMQILDLNNAREIIQADPSIQESLYTYEISAFDFLKGGLCEPSIPYETSAFDLLVLSFKNDIASRKVGNVSKNQQEYRELIDKISSMNEVIMIGQFHNGEGDMIVIERNTRKNEIQNSPQVEKDFLHIEYQTLWVNKGSFCEL